jgi:lipopolysaccharide/colanic/teichoic acid biosynthesis glycosyltransferase
MHPAVPLPTAPLDVAEAGDRSLAADLRRRDAQTIEALEAALGRGLPEPLSRASRIVKRTVDIVGASLLLVVFLPVVVMAAIAIKLETPGPVLFRQSRVGKGARRFQMLKLRSMYVDNDDAIHHDYVAKLMRGEAEAHEGVFKLVHDPRVTKVGRVIRRYSVDELPQFWNVLRGDMSLVGPRPALPREVALYDGAAHQRLAVKPGVTGLWQVSGRSRLTFSDMVELDVAYWREWTLRRDIGILLRTPVAAFSGRGSA